MKFVLIVIDKKEGTQYFGPFDDGEKALDWGEERFGDEYFLMSATLENTNDKGCEGS